MSASATRFLYNLVAQPVYVIRNSDGDYWSNDTGWCYDREDATVFSFYERNTLRLPVGGQWEERGES